MNRLDGKVALITGGARGMGAAEAQLFIQAGAQVVITDTDAIEGKAVAHKLGDACQFLSHDVTSETDWAEVVQRVEADHGRIDILINNAGIFRVMGLEDTSLKDWEQLIAVNQTGEI
jgi:3alpha(or 20beta)-hydroxysteroid dehydrogenase